MSRVRAAMKRLPFFEKVLDGTLTFSEGQHAAGKGSRPSSSWRWGTCAHLGAHVAPNATSHLETFQITDML